MASDGESGDLNDLIDIALGESDTEKGPVQGKLSPKRAPNSPNRTHEAIEKWYREEVQKCEDEKDRAIKDAESHFFAKVGRIALERDRKLRQTSYSTPKSRGTIQSPRNSFSTPKRARVPAKTPSFSPITTPIDCEVIEFQISPPSSPFIALSPDFESFISPAPPLPVPPSPPVTSLNVSPAPIWTQSQALLDTEPLLSKRSSEIPQAHSNKRQKVSPVTTTPPKRSISPLLPLPHPIPQTHEVSPSLNSSQPLSSQRKGLRRFPSSSPAEREERRNELQYKMAGRIKSSIPFWNQMLLQETINLTELHEYLKPEVSCTKDQLAMFLRSSGVLFRSPKPKVRKGANLGPSNGN